MTHHATSTESSAITMTQHIAAAWIKAGFDADALSAFRGITPADADRRLAGDGHLDVDDIEVILDRLPKVAVAEILSPACRIPWCDADCGWQEDTEDPSDVARIHQHTDRKTGIDLLMMEYYPPNDPRNDDQWQGRVSVSMPDSPSAGDYSLDEARELQAGLGRLMARAGAASVSSALATWAAPCWADHHILDGDHVYEERVAARGDVSVTLAAKDTIELAEGMYTVHRGAPILYLSPRCVETDGIDFVEVSMDGARTLAANSHLDPVAEVIAELLEAYDEADR